MNKVIQETGGHRLTNDDSVFLTAGLQEAVGHMAKTLGLTNNDISILHGVKVTKSGDDYTHTSGAIFYQDEVFTVDALSSPLTDTGTPKFAIETTFPGNNPIQYENGDSKNVHHIRKMKLVLSTHPDGLFDYDEVGFCKNKFYQTHRGTHLVPDVVNIVSPTADYHAIRRDDEVTIDFILTGQTTVDGGFAFDIDLPDEFKLDNNFYIGHSNCFYYIGTTFYAVHFMSNYDYRFVVVNSDGSFRVGAGSDGAVGVGRQIKLLGRITGRAKN